MAESKDGWRGRIVGKSGREQDRNGSRLRIVSFLRSVAGMSAN